MDLPSKNPKTGICTGDYVEVSWETEGSDDKSSNVYCADDIISICVFLSDVTLMFVIALEDHTKHGFAIKYNSKTDFSFL